MITPDRDPRFGCDALLIPGSHHRVDDGGDMEILRMKERSDERPTLYDASNSTQRRD